MAAQDVKNYADENWNQYLESILLVGLMLMHWKFLIIKMALI